MAAEHRKPQPEMESLTQTGAVGLREGLLRLPVEVEVVGIKGQPDPAVLLEKIGQRVGHEADRAARSQTHQEIVLTLAREAVTKILQALTLKHGRHLQAGLHLSPEEQPQQPQFPAQEDETTWAQHQASQHHPCPQTQ